MSFLFTTPPLDNGAVIFPDPLSEALNVLWSLPLVELQDFHFGTETPDSLGDAFPGLPYVSLSLVDSDASQHPYREVATLQITAWDESAARCLRAVQLVRAALVSAPSSERVGSVTADRRGPYTGRDPDTLSPMAFVYVRVRLLPEVIDLGA